MLASWLGQGKRRGVSGGRGKPLDLARLLAYYLHFPIIGFVRLPINKSQSVRPRVHASTRSSIHASIHQPVYPGP